MLFLVATFYTQRRGSSLVAIFVISLIYFKSTNNRTGFIIAAVISLVLLSIIGFEKIPGLSGIVNKFSSVKESGSLMNGRVFNNDPDVYLLRDDNIKLSKEQKKALITINTLCGSVYFTSDNVSDYDNEKLEMLEKARKLQNAEVVSFDRNKNLITI